MLDDRMNAAAPFSPSEVQRKVDHEAPLGRLLQDALALPIFDGGNMGIRRRQLHKERIVIRSL